MKYILLYLMIIHHLFGGPLPDKLTENPALKQKTITKFNTDSLHDQFVNFLPYVYDKKIKKYLLAIARKEIEDQQLYDLSLNILKILDKIEKIHDPISLQQKPVVVKAIFGKNNLYDQLKVLVVLLSSKIKFLLNMNKQNLYEQIHILKTNNINIEIFKIQLNIWLNKILALKDLLQNDRLLQMMPLQSSASLAPLPSLPSLPSNSESEAAAANAIFKYHNLSTLRATIHDHFQFYKALIEIKKRIIKLEDVSKEKEEDFSTEEVNEMVAYGVDYYNQDVSTGNSIRKVLFLNRAFSEGLPIFAKYTGDLQRIKEHAKKLNQLISGVFMLIDKKVSIEEQKALLLDKIYFGLAFYDLIKAMLEEIEYFFSPLIKYLDQNVDISVQELIAKLKDGDDKYEEEGIINLDRKLLVNDFDKIKYVDKLLEKTSKLSVPTKTGIENLIAENLRIKKASSNSDIKIEPLFSGGFIGELKKALTKLEKQAVGPLPGPPYHPFPRKARIRKLPPRPNPKPNESYLLEKGLIKAY